MEHVGDASVRSDMGYVSTVSRYRAQDCTGCSLRGMCYKEARDQRVIEVNHQGNAYRAEAKALLSERSERSPFRGNHMPLKNSAHKKNKRGRHFGSASLRFVGVTGFEPATTRPPDVYSNRTELRPDCSSKAVAKLVLLTLFANKSHFFFMPNGVFFLLCPKSACLSAEYDGGHAKADAHEDYLRYEQHDEKPYVAVSQDAVGLGAEAERGEGEVEHGVGKSLCHSVGVVDVLLRHQHEHQPHYDEADQQGRDFGAVGV